VNQPYAAFGQDRAQCEPRWIINEGKRAVRSLHVFYTQLTGLSNTEGKPDILPPCHRATVQPCNRLNIVSKATPVRRPAIASASRPSSRANKDYKAAVHWLRAHAAQFRLDSRRFGAWVSSADRHSAAMLGDRRWPPSRSASITLSLASCNARPITLSRRIFTGGQAALVKGPIHDGADSLGLKWVGGAIPKHTCRARCDCVLDRARRHGPWGRTASA